jgi:hypothetical protein
MYTLPYEAKKCTKKHITTKNKHICAFYIEKHIFTIQKGISGRGGSGRYFYNPEGRQMTLFS